MKGRPYATLGLAIGVHFLIMWALTYSGVAAFEHIHLNWNRFYMAVIMVAPMTIIMVLAMRHMLTDTRATSRWSPRAQTFVDDAQLSRSMIPHHSIAIKNCEHATLTYSETIQLCEEIIEAQIEEINQMEAILERLDAQD